MIRRVLGSTDLEVSPIGFGAASLGDEYGTTDPAEGARAVAAAVDLGINYFDVSPYYGRTLAEERLGRFLEGRRDQVIISTKVGRYDKDPPHGFDFSAARVIRSIEESLRRLRTDVIDLYLAHDVEFERRDVIINETLPAMRTLQEQGKVRYIGITGYPVDNLRAIAEQADVDAILSYCHYDLLSTRLHDVLTPLTEQRGIGLINASPLHMGILSDAGPPPWHPAPESVLRAGRAAAAWCREQGVNLAEIALSFAFGYDGVTSTLVGMSTEAKVHANLNTLEHPVPQDLIDSMRALLQPVQNIEWLVGLPENNPQEVMQ